MNWVFTRMLVWAELVYIKQFQIFGYVNKHLTKFVWFDTSKLLMFYVKVPEKNNLVRKALIILNSLKLGFPFGQINGSQNNLSPYWSSISISLSVITLKCSFFHSWLTMMPFFHQDGYATFDVIFIYVITWKVKFMFWLTWYVLFRAGISIWFSGK